MRFYCFSSSLFSFADIRSVLEYLLQTTPPFVPPFVGIFSSALPINIYQKGGRVIFQITPTKRTAAVKASNCESSDDYCTYRLLPLVASNIRVMTSFDAVMRRDMSCNMICIRMQRYSVQLLDSRERDFTYHSHMVRGKDNVGKCHVLFQCRSFK